jgi:hypothetical protein
MGKLLFISNPDVTFPFKNEENNLQMGWQRDQKK